MRLKSLKSKLLLVVSALVIGSSLFVTLFFAQRYCRCLFEATKEQAEHLTHAVALEACNKILTNDLVALQKVLYHQMRSNPSIAYLFVVSNDRVLAHTFPKGVPADLVNANQLLQTHQCHIQENAGSKGESYLDIAWPIFDGNASILRLGFSQTNYWKQVNSLWQQMIGVTFGILLLALSVTLLFVRRVTKPLAELTTVTYKFKQGELGVRANEEGDDEVGILAASFNHMADRLEDYTSRLEEQTLELERAHHQTRTVCNIAKEVGSLSTLEEIGSYLFDKLQDILICDQIVLLFLSGDRNPLFTLSSKEFKILEDLKVTKSAELALKSLTKVTLEKDAVFEPPIVPREFQAAVRQTMIPLHHEHQPLGALVISCPRQCECNIEEINTASLILDQIAGIIKRAISQEIEIRDLQGRMESSPEFCGMVGNDPEMQVIYRLIENISPTDANVLIQGESGTGKELVARAIHQMSPRRKKPFIVINCSALPATLLESELFGHEKGAFTGALRQKRGRFEQAHSGTVFLDEIGDIPPSAQIKLLRVLQMHKFERVGGEKTLTVDVRVLAATNKNLLKEVKRGRFREDLYYRLNVIPIFLPPLRERRNDISLLARHFLRRFAASHGKKGKKIEGFSPEAMRLMLNYSWPGNVREMENSIEYATLLAKDSQLEASDLPAGLLEAVPTSGRDRRPYLLEQERKVIQEVLDECAWNKKQAARRLGISRSTLYGKIKKYKITKPTTH